MLLAASCSVDETHLRCKQSADCASGEECYVGYCVALADSGTTGSIENGATRARDAGVRRSSGEDAGEVDAAAAPHCMPSDDDAGAPEGACCKGPVSCYDGPPETRGVGRCKAGRRACTGGTLGPCVGSVVPRPETCDNESSDDDCDGVLNNIRGRGESCMLPRDSKLCGAGRRECVSGKSDLQCVEAHETSEEVCNRWDDDCDSKVDESFDLQHDRANCGSCGMACAGDQVCCSGGCAARSANTANGCKCSADNACQNGTTCCGDACLNTRSDRANCGACGYACAAAQSCCNGVCVDMRTDPANCGRCGGACTANGPTCCNGICSDITRDGLNCGGCGRLCGPALLCSCQPQNGAGICVSRVNGDICQ
jgi:hypothetical protein